MVINVWAVNDSVRVDPIRNEAFEDNQHLSPDGIRRGYKQSNLIWDGTSRRITFKAARNQTVVFQIVIERTGEKLTSVMVALAGAYGPRMGQRSRWNISTCFENGTSMSRIQRRRVTRWARVGMPMVCSHHETVWI